MPFSRLILEQVTPAQGVEKPLARWREMRLGGTLSAEHRIFSVFPSLALSPLFTFYNGESIHGNNAQSELMSCIAKN